MTSPHAAPAWTHDRFRARHITRNPFGFASTAELGALSLPDLPLDEIVARLKHINPARPFACVFMGPRGHGKSTHLAAIHAHFSQLPLTRLPEDAPAPQIPKARVVFVDESQRLPLFRRRRLFRRRAHLVLATHQCHAAELCAAGFEVVVHHVGTLGDAAFLRRVDSFVDGRMAWATTGTGDPPQVPSALRCELVARHGQNLRAIQDELYDWFQAQL